ncbi:hypothetical protein [Thorsellia anophelis]|uniref:DUF3298 domain-containing protein n=1 Tax=Thorsellia anophelis DSM 18579 TaxID=1123402 RepID=A0A1I0DSV5_9GAMM|nr:hypothetical protein [Thorsellia anophelis]SET35679.1 hypothetical protein SAMN02583745_02116 [Thorsellia anophelis DSM 18579]
MPYLLFLNNNYIKRIRFILIVLISAILFISVCAQAATYTGRIGNEEIILELTDDEREPEISYIGRYFKQKLLVDMPVIGIENQEELKLFEGFERTDSSTYIQLLYQDAGFIGKRIETSTLPTNEQPVYLHKIQYIVTSPSDSDYLLELSVENPYEYLRQKKFQFKEIDYQSMQMNYNKRNHLPLILPDNLKHSFVWFNESISGFDFFKLVIDDENKGNLIVQNNAEQNTDTIAPNIENADNKINSELEIIFRRMLADFATCFHYEEYSTTMMPVFLSDKFLSIQLETHMDCGGAHPVEIIKGITFNRRTGNRMTLTELLNFAEPSAIAPWAVEQIKTHHQVHLSDTECDYQKASNWEWMDESGWALTPDGLMLIPEGFPEYQRSCKFINWAIIPFDSLNIDMH